VPVTALAGIHAGCYELFVREPVQVVRDLRGRSIGIAIPNGAGHQLMSIIAAYIGLDPRTEIDWIAAPDGKPLDLFVDGKVDAFLAFPPEPQELRARGIGRVILSTATDKPWSQYFCCMLFSGRDFVDAHPVATKRALRAILKATEMCSADPEWTARQLVEGGFTDQYDYALQTVAEIRYDQWREFDPEDSLRFYALRLHELGMITSTPARIIADGTDWRFLDELKRELKT
jgi:NitT/TauT family transport system substrate-binding protein